MTAAAPVPPAVWQPDVLGDDFEATSLDLGSDDEGPVTATLVRHSPPRHGLAEGVRAALRVIRQGTNDRSLVLMGHSTGGLILSLWAARHPDVAAALVLNSPWLEFSSRPSDEQMLAPLVNLRAQLRTLDVAPQLDFGLYTRAQRTVDGAGDLQRVNPQWRPERAHRGTAGWLRAILSGQARLSRRTEVGAPAFVLLSSRSSIPTKWSDDLLASDSVLDVEGAARASLNFGSRVSVARVDGALHDVFLSAHDARAAAYRHLEEWMIGWRASTTVS